jgi:hypothetical protein
MNSPAGSATISGANGIAEHGEIRHFRIADWRGHVTPGAGSSGARRTSIRNLIDPVDQALHMLMEIAAGIDRCGIKKRKILQAFGKLRTLRHPGRAD